MDKKNKYTYLIIILLLSIPAIRYLFVDGFYGVSDDLHIGWLYEMHRAVTSFKFPPRYVPDLSYGFGYPLFTFVYPLPFYMAEVFKLVGFSLVDSIKIIFGLSIPLSMFFMFKLLRKFLGNELSFAGSILYVYAPYRALELFVRGSIGEIVAFIFFPIIILSVIEGKYLILALSFSALVLSHNILSFMFLPFLILLLFLVKKHLLFNLKGILLGLLISGYFWVPAIFESNLMKYDTVFNYYDHFPAIRQLITPYWGYGASVPGNYDTMSFYLGIVGILVVFFGILMFLRNLKHFEDVKKKIIFWSVITFLVSIFMMNYRSDFIWRNIPLMPYFQFPWRFLAMTTLVTPVFLIVFSDSKYQKTIAILVSFFAIVLNFNYFKTSEYLGRQDDYYLNRYIPNTIVSEEYKKTAEEYLRLPKENQYRPDKVYPRAYTDSSGVDLVINETNSLDAVITSTSAQDFVFNYNKYNYPGWVAKIDGEKVDIVSGKPYGQIQFIVPSGEHQIEVKYSESGFRLVFDVVSLLTLIYVLRKIV